MKRRKKVHGVAWHKKELWKVFTKFIKNRDKWICFTCGKKTYGAGGNGGHFVSAGASPPSLYFDEDNVHCQCIFCNLTLEGNHYVYGLKLGKKRADRLIKMRQQYVGEVWTITQYQEKIEHYKKELDKLLNKHE